MTIDQLALLRSNIDIEIDRQAQKALAEKTMTKEELIKTFSGFGYHTPKGSVFWRVRRGGEYSGMYGLEVGRYTHSCHIETSDFIVLLLYVPHYHTQIEEFNDLSLEKAFVV